MNEAKILDLLKKFSKKLSHFEDGRIDYSDSDEAPVIIVFVKSKDKILLLKRSDKVRTYKRRWNTVAGYLDEIRPIREKIIEELRDEIGINENNVKSINIKDSYKIKDKEIDKTWIVHPALVELKNKIELKLDWEHTEYKWIKVEELKNFDTVKDLDKSLMRILK